MNVINILAILLIAAGVLVLVYSNFSYNTKTHKTTLGGPVDLAIKNQQTIRIPVWVGVVGIAIGSLILFL